MSVRFFSYIYNLHHKVDRMVAPKNIVRRGVVGLDFGRVADEKLKQQHFKKIVHVTTFFLIHGRSFVRVVKEVDLKSTGPWPRRFKSCSDRFFLFLSPSWHHGMVAGVISTGRSFAP